ncbi:hypothetical protein C8A00DRAFT_32022 [Chaetomidium leptoderma]|uniref:Uncharacterized protein n=1 Tax=Chaetomidium leptoderma TaxID=669021 RepID=A0AAN6VPF1_9PEZI|nr:hypothetical protein C8A00DRAFT_32022 [Chaetomidium leptoderma]
MDSSKTTQPQKVWDPKELAKAQEKLMQHSLDNERAKAVAQAHSANPGPAIPKEFNIKEEGTKEERRAKKEELNK